MHISNQKGGVTMAYEVYSWTITVLFLVSGPVAVTTMGILHAWNLPNTATKKVIRRAFVASLVLLVITSILIAGTLETELIEERIVKSYTLVPLSGGEYYKKDNDFLIFCHFSEPDEHFWLSTDFSSASDKTIVIEKIVDSNISVEEVFSPDSDKKAFEILQQTTVQKARLPFGIVLTSNRPQEKELYRLRLTTLDESLPKTSIGISCSP